MFGFSAEALADGLFLVGFQPRPGPVKTGGDEASSEPSGTHYLVKKVGPFPCLLEARNIWESARVNPAVEEHRNEPVVLVTFLPSRIAPGVSEHCIPVTVESLRGNNGNIEVRGDTGLLVPLGGGDETRAEHGM